VGYVNVVVIPTGDSFAAKSRPAVLGTRTSPMLVGFNSEGRCCKSVKAFLHRFSWCLSQLSQRAILIAICLLRFAIRYAGIMPIAKMLKKDSVIIRFMLHARHNGEISTEHVGIKN
jgi:hypothetical protein